MREGPLALKLCYRNWDDEIFACMRQGPCATPCKLSPPSSHPPPPQVSKFDDLHDAALSVVAESYRLWLQ